MGRNFMPPPRTRGCLFRGGACASRGPRRADRV
jgi:hypothetical protein